MTSEIAKVNSERMSLECVSPRDPKYPIAVIMNGFEKGITQAEEVAEKIYETVVKETPSLALAREATERGVRYVVDMSEEMLGAVESGKIKLTTDRLGNMYAQVVGEKGRYGDKIPIKREELGGAVSPSQMAGALQLKALQDQVQDMADQIEAIDRSVREVLRGQQNDRLGLYHSGLALYLEARSSSDDQMRRALIAQALRSLSDATAQLSMEMQSDIRYLEDGSYKKEKGKSRDAIDARMQKINQCFDFIHRSSMLRAGIYCEMGEIGSMKAVLDGYAWFLEETVAAHSSLLSEGDVSDSGTVKGVWSKRAKLGRGVADIAGHLVAPEEEAETVLYLGVGSVE